MKKANHLGVHNFQSKNVYADGLTYAACLGKPEMTGVFILFAETEREDVYNNVIVDEANNIQEVYWYGKNQLKPKSYQSFGEEKLPVILRNNDGSLVELIGAIHE